MCVNKISLTGEQNAQVAGVRVCVLADCNVVMQWMVAVTMQSLLHQTLRINTCQKAQNSTDLAVCKYSCIVAIKRSAYAHHIHRYMRIQ